MSVNLISLASQYLTPDTLRTISSTLGLEKSVIGKACMAAIPALFGSFAKVASSPDGARKLHDAVSRQGTDMLNDLPSTMQGQSQHGSVKNGAGSLSSLLGGTSSSALTGALGKFTGLGQTSASSLLGMLAPIVMAILGKQSAEQGLDSAGLSRLLASQKDNITAAMPSGFKNLLEPSTAQPSRVKLSGFSTDQAQSSSWGRTLTWLLPLIAVALFGWWLLGDRTANVAEQTRPQVAQTQASATVGGVDLRSSAQKALDSVNTTLQGIKDEGSAQAALPTLQSAGSELDDVIKLSGQLPDASKKALAGLVAAAQPATTQLFDKVLTIPGVTGVAKPQIDSLRAKINTLSKDQVRL